MMSWLKTADSRSNEPNPGKSNKPVEHEEDNSSATLATLNANLDTDGTASVSKRRKMTTRRYDTSYLSLGFTYSGPEEEPRPQSVVCCEILSNESMKTAHLRQHLSTKHEHLKDTPV